MMTTRPDRVPAPPAIKPGDFIFAPCRKSLYICLDCSEFCYARWLILADPDHRLVGTQVTHPLDWSLWQKIETPRFTVSCVSRRLTMTV